MRRTLTKKVLKNLRKQDAYLLNELHEIGSGAFGTVYVRSDMDTVVKIHSNDAYNKYAAWVYENKLWKQNPAFPKIYSRKKIRGGWATEIERLKPMTEEQSNAMSHPYDYGNLPRNVGKALREIAHKKFGTMDLGDDNFMRRGRSIVITDPVA